MSLLHFLLIYDHNQHKLIDIQRFGEEGDRATEAYSECEEKYRDREDIEIVLVGADSLETIQRTHSHYFRDARDVDLFRELTGA
jgi:hypothetical protein